MLPTRARLHRILPRSYQSPDCNLCDRASTPETMKHALGSCPANLGLPARLLELLRIYQPGAKHIQLLTLDLGLDSSLELPITWTICSLLFSIWRQRTEGRVSLAKTRAELEAKCRLLREGRVSSLLNAYTQTYILLCSLFSKP